MVVSRRTACLIAAVAAFTVFTLLGFGVLHGAHSSGWLGAGLVALTAAFI